MWNASLALLILDKVNTFHGISAFFKHNFCLAPWWKINWARWIFFYISYLPAEIFKFSCNPRCKTRWPPGFLDRVYCYLSNTFSDTIKTLQYIEIFQLRAKFGTSMLLYARDLLRITNSSNNGWISSANLLLLYKPRSQNVR